jgi:hypothetical protein
MLPPKFFGTLTAVAHLPPLILADWSPGKAAQINFYVNGTCAPQYIYSSAATSWWSVSPLVGIGSITGAECFTLNLVGRSTGINTGMMWEQSPPKDGIEPNQANGSCTFWDGVACYGKKASSSYVAGGVGGGTCQPARSAMSGLLWKSAKCMVLPRRV